MIRFLLDILGSTNFGAWVLKQTFCPIIQSNTVDHKTVNRHNIKSEYIRAIRMSEAANLHGEEGEYEEYVEETSTEPTVATTDAKK